MIAECSGSKVRRAGRGFFVQQFGTLSFSEPKN